MELEFMELKFHAIIIIIIFKVWSPHIYSCVQRAL